MLQIRYDNKLRYRNNYAFVTISAAILVARGVLMADLQQEEGQQTDTGKQNLG
jgi:hypothetical protein